MSYQFVNQPFEQGAYEPEGIYLDCPFDKPARLIQRWGTNAKIYNQYHYNGVALKGYIGLSFAVEANTTIVAVDQGRISEINLEPGGFERYIKMDHWWGESLYARLGAIYVESGQLLDRNTPIAVINSTDSQFSLRFHFGIRIHPYNRFDGWGGFSDPLPFLNPTVLGNYFIISDAINDERYPPLPMAVENNNTRRS